MCKENHIIFISNGAANDNASQSGQALGELSRAGGNPTEIGDLTGNKFLKSAFDEWARFMSADPDPAQGQTRESKPVIYTHSILVQAADAPPGQFPADWERFLNYSTVTYGKGSFFKANGTESSIKNALESAFKEIQATNSVFASSALPINTTVRGTFLNQVYMGVFRPEASAAPRWTGNLKLYKIAATTNATTGAVESIFLAGQDNQPIEDQTNGFTKTLARSFWTSNSSFWDQTFASLLYNYSEIAGGGGASDIPDGEFVEKGGAAQRLRTVYDGTSGKELANRKLYTHLSATTPSVVDDFNTSLDASYFGLAQSVSISSMSRTGGTVTLTAAGHGFASGDVVSITGVLPAEYNVSAAISNVTANTFTYPINELPVSPATTSGTIQASLASSASAISVSGIARTGDVANVNTVAAHGLVTGDRVEIAGATQSGYNGVVTITRPTIRRLPTRFRRFRVPISFRPGLCFVRR